MPQQDLQSLDRNYFWTERPKAVVRELKDYFDKVEDVSYINDNVPSIMVNSKYQVYLPTSIRETMSETETNNYGVIRDEDIQLGNTENMFFTQNLDEVIEAINAMIEHDATIKKSEVIHRMQMVMDDLLIIRQQVSELQLKTSTGYADDLYTHFNNVAIACDLDSDECLSWGLYPKEMKIK